MKPIVFEPDHARTRRTALVAGEAALGLAAFSFVLPAVATGVLYVAILVLLVGIAEAWRLTRASSYNVDDARLVTMKGDGDEVVELSTVTALWIDHHLLCGKSVSLWVRQKKVASVLLGSPESYAFARELARRCAQARIDPSVPDALVGPAYLPTPEKEGPV